MKHEDQEISVDSFEPSKAVQQLVKLKDARGATSLTLHMENGELVLARAYGEARVRCSGSLDRTVVINRREQKKWAQFGRLASEEAKLRLTSDKLKVPGCELSVKTKPRKTVTKQPQQVAETSSGWFVLEAPPPGEAHATSAASSESLVSLLDYAAQATDEQIAASGMAEVVKTALATADRIVGEASNVLRPLGITEGQVRNLVPVLSQRRLG